PQPSRNSATNRSSSRVGGASAAMSEAATRTAVPRKIVRSAPKRWVMRPEIGASAYIPATWPLITTPTVPRAPGLWAVIWSGVMVMMRTIVACPAISAAIAATTAGWLKIWRADTSGLPSPSDGLWIVDSSAIANGSGRRKNQLTAAARLTNTIGMRYGPASVGRPSAGAMAPAIGTSVGPIRPPTVEPHTTSPIATARRFGGTRSAAAYRDRFVDEFPNPIRNVPKRSKGKDRM